MSLKEIYNTSKGFWITEGDIIKVHQVEVDGYLGMVFSSSLFKDSSCDVQLEFSFVDEKGAEIEKAIRTIHMFRPDVVVEEVLPIIEISFLKKSVEGKIRMKNKGEGTAIVAIETPDESEIKKKLPKDVREFRSRFKEDLTEQLAKVQVNFPKYSQTLNEFLENLNDAFRLDEESISKEWASILERMKTWNTKATKVFEADEDFLYAFAEALAVTFLKNIQIITIFETFLNYLESIAHRKVILADPFEVLEVAPRPQNVLLKVVPIDLLGRMHEPIVLPLIQIRADKEGEIPLYELIEWMV